MKQDTLTKFNHKKKMWISPKHPFYRESITFRKMYSAGIFIQAGLNKSVNALNNYELERLIIKGLGLKNSDMAEVIRLARTEERVVEYLLENLKEKLEKYIFIMDLTDVCMRSQPISDDELKAISLYAEIMEIGDEEVQLLFRFIQAAFGEDTKTCMQLYMEMEERHMGLSMAELKYYILGLEYVNTLTAEKMEREKKVRITDRCAIPDVLVLTKGMHLLIEYATVELSGEIILEGGTLELRYSQIIKRNASYPECILVKNQAEVIITDTQIDCKGHGRFLYQKDGSLRIQQSKISRTTGKAAVQFWGQKICIEDTMFEDCYSSEDGGAIFITGGLGHIKGCHFIDCEAVRGGGIYTEDGIAILDCTFEQCRVPEFGSAIYYNGEIKYNVQGADCNKCCPKYTDIVQYMGGKPEWRIDKEYHIKYSTLIDCPVTIEEMGLLEIEGGVIILNHPIVCKGVLQIKNARLMPHNVRGDMVILKRARGCNIVKSEIDGMCLASGIRATGTRITISRSVFRNIVSGRAIFDAQAPVITESVFNYCQDGAIHCRGGKITRNIFVNCRAKHGAGIMIFGSRGEIRECTFKRCVSDYAGGAVDKNGGHMVANCTCEDCKLI